VISPDVSFFHLKEVGWCNEAASPCKTETEKKCSCRRKRDCVDATIRTCLDADRLGLGDETTQHPKYAT